MQSYSCWCDKHPPFFECIHDSSIIIQCKVISHHYNFYKKFFFWKVKSKSPFYMKVKIIKKYYNGNSLPDTVTIVGGQGVDCVEQIEPFHIGKSYIFNLICRDTIDTKTKNHKFNKNELIVWVCGEHWLEVENNLVLGDINKNIKSKSTAINLSEFDLLIQKELFEE